MRLSFSKALLLGTSALSMVTVSTAHAYLSPLSFNEMYAYASQGNLKVLNNAILRGMNINSVNSDGDTGICVAIRRNDHTAYESFRNAGAHTHPHCLNEINQQQYKKFVVAHRPYEQQVYNGKSSSLWWWIGGAAAVGGIAAIAGGGGGGGGGGSSEPAKTPDDPNFHTDKGLSYIVGTTSPSEPEGETYAPVLVTANHDMTKVNRQTLDVSNNSKMWVYNSSTFVYDTVALADLIDFASDINLYTKYIQVGMKANNKSVVINDSGQTINLGNNTVALDASLYSSASNLGTIAVNAQNGTIAMVAGDYSTAGNLGTISMDFSGKATSHQVIGMYADTNSSVTNSGTISAKADNAFGKVTGMQTQLTNYYTDFTNTAVNSGQINISGSSTDSGALGLWGMSSWLDKAFIKSNKPISQLDQAVLTNSGTITLSLALQKSDDATTTITDPLSLAYGTGGVVGIHADAHTIATNRGTISVTVTGDSGESMAAGMQAVRGGNITNEQNIAVSSEGSAYGMMAISGANSGSNFTNVESSIVNKGNITVTAADTGYGIYSDTRGKVTSNGSISLNGAGYGIFNKNGNTETSGSITVAGTGEKKSYGIYAEATSERGYTVKNAANIIMTFTPEESEDGSGNDGDDTEPTPTPPSNYGIYGWNVDIDNSGQITMTQLNETANDLFGILAENSNITNHGQITLNGNGSAVYAGGGDLTNDGKVTLNGDGYGLIAEDGNLTNSGEIHLNGYGYAVLNDGGNLTNNGAITLNGSGWGLYVNNGNLINDQSGHVNIVSDNSAMVYGLMLEGNNHQLTNQADITLSANVAEVTQSGAAIVTNGSGNTITNTGTINIGNNSVVFQNALGIFANGGTISNSGNITIYGSGSNTFGLFNTNSDITNSGNVTIHGSGSGIYNQGGKVTNNSGGNIQMVVRDNNLVTGIAGTNHAVIENHAQITISSADATSTGLAIGIDGNLSAITNAGDIKIGDSNNIFDMAIGINSVSENLTNSGTIRIYGAGSGIKGTNASIVNNTNGTITMVLNGAADSYGIYLNGTAGADNLLTNRGIIKLNKSAAFATGNKVSALYAENADINNFGNIEVGTGVSAFDGSSGIETNGGDIVNQGTVMVYGNGAALKAVNGNIVNNGGGNLSIYTDGKAYTYGIYANGTAANTITNNASIALGQLNGYAQAAVGTASNYGIWTNNAKIINSGDISLGNSANSLSDIFGIYAAENGSIENSGVINLYNAGTAIYTKSGSVNNLSTSGIINISTSGSGDSYGIKTTLTNANLINNQNRISITAQSSAYSSTSKNIGIYANNIKNSGNIQIGSAQTAMANAYGIFGNTITNSGNILLYGNAGVGIYSESTSAAFNNSGTIEITNCTSGTCYGIYAKSTSGNSQIYNSGAITVTSNSVAYGIRNDAGTVENRAAITMNSSASYGILAKTIENYGNININMATGYGLATDGGSITNYAKITATGSQNDGIYGKNSSTFHNEGDIEINGENSWGIRSTNNVSAYNKGAITMNSSGSYGILLTNGTAVNEGLLTLNSNNSYGIRVKNVTSLTNRGKIAVNGSGSYGIYAEGNSVVNNSGQINVNGSNSYGIYATETSKVTNSGDIYLNPLTATSTTAALYANGNANINNSGKLYIKGSSNSNIFAAYTEGSGKIVNTGTIYVAAEADKNTIFHGDVTNNGTIEVSSGTMSLNSNIKFSDKSRFVAQRINGEATVSADTVKQSNQTSFTLHDNFIGNTNGLNIKSQSYLFDAEFDGNATTLSMKSFDEVENNASVAEFLQSNYSQNNNIKLYDALKSATTQTELNHAIDQHTGRDFIPALTARNIDMMKDLNRQLDNAWFNAKENDRLIAGFNYYHRQHNSYRRLSGSDDNAASLFGLFRNTSDSQFEYGFGWTITKADSKFDNNNRKDEVIAQILLPFGITGENFRLFSNLYGGYGNGDYKRYAENRRYKGDVENYYYGFNNELRGEIDAGYGFSLQPTVEFNLTGLYQSGIDDGELDIRHTNNISAESGLGLYLHKELQINDENLLQLRFGGSWYHEFNKDYQTVKAQIAGMEGHFAMERYKIEPDHGLLSLNGEYRNGNFSLYGETAYILGHDDNWIFNTGFKYAF